MSLELPAQDDADDEALGPVVEVVQVDDGDLGVVDDAVARRVGHVGADEVLDVAHRPGQPADERVDRALPDGATGPALTFVVVVAVDLVVDEVDQLAEGAHGRAVDGHGAVAAGPGVGGAGGR